MTETAKTNRSRRTARLPLATHELARVRQVTRRLRAEVGSALQSLPKRYLSAGLMSQELKVNRTVCHRLLTALDTARDDLAIVAALPGVQGLNQCIRAMERHGADATRTAAAAAAVEQFSQLIRDLGGSHAGLTARLSVSTPSASVAGRSAVPRGRRKVLRQQLFESAAALMGRRIEARCGLSILRPSPARPTELEYAHVRFFSGHEASADATPLVVASSIVSVEGGEQAMSGFCSLDGVPLGSSAQNAILAPFSSDPLPLVTARDLSGRLVHLIDPKVEERRRGLDIALGYLLPSLCAIPSCQEVPVLLEALHMREPSAAMVFDVYLHSSLTVGCRPSAEVFVGRGSGLCDIIDRWYDQVDGSPVLTLLGPGLGNAPTPLVPRLSELTEHVFGRLGWNAAEFVGYRCEEVFPLWGCDYVMAFDYRREAAVPLKRGS